MEQKWRKVFDDVRFMFVLLAGIDSVLAAKLSMMTGQTVYWILAVICAVSMIFGVCQKPNSES